MFNRSIRLLIIAGLAMLASTTVFGQSADGTSPLNPGDRVKEEAPKSVREMMDKLRIEQEKKDYAEMLERGDKALKLTDELETSLSDNRQITEKEREKLAALEKLVKRIRGDLGGGDDESADEQEKEERPSSIREGFTTLKNATVKLVDELKKTTRFSISAAAIHTSNAVLRLTRFLRFGR